MENFDSTSKRQERFQGITRHPQEADLENIRSILEAWVKDGSGEIREDAIGHIVEVVGKSLKGEGTEHFVVAEEKGSVIGIMGYRPVSDTLRPFTKTERPVELINAYVDDQALGQGVGSVLLNEIERSAIAAGFTELILTSGVLAKDSAWSFYEKKFGAQIGTRKDRDGRDVPVWSKKLVHE